MAGVVVASVCARVRRQLLWGACACVCSGVRLGVRLGERLSERLGERLGERLVGGWCA